MSDPEEYEPGERRPISSRNLSWVKATASWLARRDVSPNSISASSTLFAVLGAVALASTAHFEGVPQRLLWLGGALGAQLRLLANLLDGMVALKSGKASPVGELFNEVPDRISDAALFVALAACRT